MLRAYSTNITATADEPIVFNINKFNTDASIIHNSNSGDVVLQRPGYYEVDFNISASLTEASTDPVVIQLYANGTAIPDAIIQTTLTEGSYGNLTFNTIIKANPGSMGQTVTLTVVPNSALTIADTAIGVDRVNIV